jgi:hypothetical protein
MAAPLEHETFSKHLDSNFSVQAGNAGKISLKLTRVNELQLSPHQERFSISFRGPAQPALPQGSYDFEHDEMGSFLLFIVPLHGDEEGILYEAVFNRLRNPD